MILFVVQKMGEKAFGTVFSPQVREVILEWAVER